MQRITITALALMIAISAGCSSAYYTAWEKLGVHKRDILVERVEDARDSQDEAKEQFASALEEFRAVLGAPETELSVKYKKLKSELDRSEKRANDVTGRIEKVEKVGEDLFTEWEKELDQYENPTLRRSSEKQLRDTRESYDQMIAAMRKAESKIEPVLSAFRDQVLYLKHNLNAQTVASLKSELVNVEGEIAALIKEMEASIKEADSFIKSMGTG